MVRHIYGKDFNNPLAKAIHINDIAAVQSLINDGAFGIEVFKSLLIKCAKGILGYTDIVKALVNKPGFNFTAAHVISCVQELDATSLLHNVVIEKIKHSKNLDQLSLKETTGLLLMIAQASSKELVSRYFNLFSKKKQRECQEYFILNFESYFHNCYYEKKSSLQLQKKIREFAHQVLTHKNTFKDTYKKSIKMPNAQDVGLGEEIKYLDMFIVLYYFIKRQNQKRYSSLFNSSKQFFIFFAMHIKPHQPHNEADGLMKTLFEKYQLSSLSWDYTYFKDVPIQIIQKKIESSIDKALLFYNLKDLSQIHLQLKSPQKNTYNGSFWNPYNAYAPKNFYIIQMNKEGLLDFSSTFVHEMAHYIHMHPKNKDCFQNHVWKRLKDKLYLNEKRIEVFNELNKSFPLEPELVEVFHDYMHATEPVFSRQLEKFFKKHGFTEKAAVYSIFHSYKKYKHQDSKQFIIWKKLAQNGGLMLSYYNKNREIHARLNEILSGEEPMFSNCNQYLTAHSTPFHLLKDDLSEFNRRLLKSI